MVPRRPTPTGHRLRQEALVVMGRHLRTHTVRRPLRLVTLTMAEMVPLREALCPTRTARLTQRQAELLTTAPPLAGPLPATRLPQT